MINADSFRDFALQLPETVEEPHFKLTSFRVGKKIFSTLNPPENRGTLRFSSEMQHIFCAVSKGAIYPVPNKWGQYGWTNVNLPEVEEELLKDALLIAWREVAPAAFRKKYPIFFEDEVA